MPSTYRCCCCLLEQELYSHCSSPPPAVLMGTLEANAKLNCLTKYKCLRSRWDCGCPRHHPWGMASSPVGHYSSPHKDLIECLYGALASRFNWVGMTIKMAAYRLCFLLYLCTCVCGCTHVYTCVYLCSYFLHVYCAQLHCWKQLLHILVILKFYCTTI